MNKILAAALLLCFATPAPAQVISNTESPRTMEGPSFVPADTVAVIRPADLNDVGRIIHEELPPRYGQMVAAWVNGLTARYKAEQDAQKKQSEKKEP